MTSPSVLRSINPLTGETIQEYARTIPREVDAALSRARGAFERWRRTRFAERSQAMRSAAALLLERKEAYATLMAREMGKPIAQGRSEVEKCAWVATHFAEHAEGLLIPEPVEAGARESFVAFQPLGAVLAVMPWNFPFWQVFRFAAPALMAGNAAVLKHASNVSGCALAIGDLMRDAGFPRGLFEVLLLPSEEIGQVIEAPEIAAITLTGSGDAGRAVAAQSGRALKKTVLELGGSDAYVILEDADVEEAARICATSRLINAGQSCIAAKRFIILEEAHGAFVERLVEEMNGKRIGDPLDESTDVGPLARHDLRDEVDRQVKASIAAGARAALGGSVTPGPGAFYPPTVLTGVHRGMPAYAEEVFGPVAAVIRVRNEEEALAAANDSVFGLGAAVFTRDLERGRRLATESIEAGSCFVNDLVRSDPRLPFGGIKQSGYGRELSSYGVREFVNVKTVLVR